LGIPSVKFGLGPVSTPALLTKNTGTRDEAVRVDEYVNMAQIYALTAMKVCSHNR